MHQSLSLTSQSFEEAAGSEGELNMNFARWKDLAELIGVLSIVASLIFVGLEVRKLLESDIRMTKAEAGSAPKDARARAA